MAEDIVEIIEDAPETPQEGTTAAVVALPVSGPLVEPVASIETIEAAYRNYEELCSRLVVASDWQDLPGKGKFLKKSGWRKLAVAMGVSVEIISVETIHDDDGKINHSTVTARATAPNGRSMDGIGACSVDERRFSRSGARERAEHDIPSTASTRATNRACADLFGFGAVSAEEMEGTDSGKPDRVYPGTAEEDATDGKPYRVPSMRDASAARDGAPATEKQLRLVRFKMGEWRKEAGLEGRDDFPAGWADAGLPFSSADLLKGQIDTVLELLDQARTTGAIEQRPQEGS